MKKFILLILLFVPFLLQGQDLPFNVKAKTKYSTSAMVGYTEVDSVKYSQLRLIQEFNYKKVGIGLDLDFLFDRHMHLKKSDWDNLSDAIDKIYYIRYGKRQDTFFGHLGGFPGVTMGNGLIMQNYSNMQLYPELRKTGLMLGANPHWPTDPSFELFSSDLDRFPVTSFSARFTPLPDSSVKVLDHLTVGVSLAVDWNQYANLKQLNPDLPGGAFDHLKRDPATVMGIAYTLPIVHNEKVTLGQYAEFANIAGYGSGAILPGVYADLNYLKLTLEYRIYGSEFTPAFFDKYYEEERATAVWDQYNLLQATSTKEDLLQTIKPAQGWNGSIQAFIAKKVKARFAWQNMIGKDLKGKSIWMSVWVDTQYKRLENCSLSYAKTNTESMAIHHINQPNTDIKTSATFRAYKEKLYLIGKYSVGYRDRDGNGEIDLLKEAKRNVGIGIKYIY